MRLCFASSSGGPLDCEAFYIERPTGGSLVKGPAEVLLFLLLDLAIIIAAARSVGALARRMGQPSVIGEIIAGILLGPTVLGRISPGAPAALFPNEVPLSQLADLGLVFFMFLVGLELDPRLMRKEGQRALSISLSGVVAPFLLGALIAVPLLSLNNGGLFASGVAKYPTAAPFALLMGAAMCITAFPVLARILVERGLYKTSLGTTVLCAAAVDDVIAWTLLAGVVGITRTGSAGEAAGTVAWAAIFVVSMLTIGRRMLKHLARRYEANGHLTVDQVAAVVVGLLLSACFTDLIGIHSIFGAFIFGTIMPRASRMTRELTDKLEDFTVVVLLPVFFMVAGLRTNLFSINSPELIGWTVVVTGAAIIGKLGGCGLAAYFNGSSPRDSLAVGTLMNARGMTELVILTVGFTLGVLSDRTFAMMVVMALVTTFMAAPILRRIIPRREMVRLLAGGDQAFAKYRVLVAIGNPDNAHALVDAGIKLTGAQRPSELLVVRLIPTPRAPEFRSGLRDEESQVDQSVEAMDRLCHQAGEAGVPARTLSFLSDDVGQDLAYVAESQHCDLVLLGWHRPSLERNIVRALVRRVFTFASCDVVVFVDRQGAGIQKAATAPVLVPADANDGGRSALEIGTRLAEGLQTTVRETTARNALESFRQQSDKVAAVVIRAVAPGTETDEFGQLTTSFEAAANCPVLVVLRKPDSSRSP
jgi:Kef-type K+ transport system membrane component KefB